MWFTYPVDIYSSGVGRITPSGSITLFPIPTPNTSVPSITVGPDGALWFVENAVDQIGRITMAGQISEYALPEAPATNIGFFGDGDNPILIATGSDGRLWVLDNGANAGIFAVSPDQPLSSDFNYSHTPSGMTLEFDDLTFHDPDPSSSASSYAISVDWGDGTTSTPAITTNGPGSYTLSGSHTYSVEGTYSVTIQITDMDTSHDLGGSSLSTTRSSGHRRQAGE